LLKGMQRVPSDRGVSVSVSWPTFVTETRLSSSLTKKSEPKRREGHHLRSESETFRCGSPDCSRCCQAEHPLPPWMRLTRFWCLVFAVFCIVGGSIYNVILTRLSWIDHQKLSVGELAALKSWKIANKIQTSIGALRTLEAMLRVDEPGLLANFRQLALTLRRTYKGITGLALAEHGVISQVDSPNFTGLIGYPLMLPPLQEEALAVIHSREMKVSVAWDASESVLVVLHPIFTHHAPTYFPSAQWTFDGRNLSRDCSGAETSSSCYFPGGVDSDGRETHLWGFALLLSNWEDILSDIGLEELDSGGFSAGGLTLFRWRLFDTRDPSRAFTSQKSESSELFEDRVASDLVVPGLDLRWQIELAPIQGWLATSRWWVNALAAFPVTVVLGVGMGLKVIASLRKRTLDKLAFAAYKKDVMAKAITASIETLENYQFPLCLISAEEFMEFGELLPYEALRDEGRHVWVEDCWEALEFYQASGILLLSYEGEDVEGQLRDEDGSIYKAMVQGIVRLRNYGLKISWVWLEHCSMPQQNRIQHQCALNSLPGYLSCFTAMLAVEGRQSGMEQEAFQTSLGSLGRLERQCFLTCHCLENSTDKVFKYSQKGVLRKDRIDSGALELSWDIMRGSFSCCRKQHPGGKPCDKQRFVGAILGTYWRLLAANRAAPTAVSRELVKLLQDNPSRYLPSTTTYWSAGGPCQVELFKGMEEVLQEMFQEDTAKSDDARAIVPMLAGSCRAAEQSTVRLHSATKGEMVLAETF